VYELIVFSKNTLDKNFEVLEVVEIIKKAISVCICTSNTMFTLQKGGGPKYPLAALTKQPSEAEMLAAASVCPRVNSGW